MKIVDTKSEPAFRVRVNRTGRRTYSREYKLEIIQECSVPGASVAAIALSHRINASQVRKWIVLHRAGGLCAMPAMLPVTVGSSLPASMPPPPKACAAGVIEVELESARIRIRGAVDSAALRTVLDALRKR